MILITGSSSYIGKNLIQYFEKKNISYMGIDIEKPYNNRCIQLDINKYFLLNKIKKKISKIIHLAAISSDKQSKKDLTKCYDINIIGTYNILKFSKKKNVKKLVFASTEWVYGDFENKIKKSFKSEINISNLRSHYAISKAICEKMIVETMKINYSILRFGIIYGNKKKNYTAVESIVDQVKKRKNIEINSKKTARSFIHIKDVIKSIYLSANHMQKNILDIQGNKLVTLDKIIKITSSYLSKKVNIKETNNNKPSIRFINSKLSHKKINFTPKIDINEGIKLILKNE